MTEASRVSVSMRPAELIQQVVNMAAQGALQCPEYAEKGLVDERHPCVATEYSYVQGPVTMRVDCASPGACALRALVAELPEAEEGTL